MLGGGGEGRGIEDVTGIWQILFKNVSGSIHVVFQMKQRAYSMGMTPSSYFQESWWPKS